MQSAPETLSDDLAEVLAAWADLPDAAKAGVLALVRASVPEAPAADMLSSPR